MENCTCNFNSHVPTYFTRKTLSLQHKIEKMDLKNVLLQHFTIFKFKVDWFSSLEQGVQKVTAKIKRKKEDIKGQEKQRNKEDKMNKKEER